MKLSFRFLTLFLIFNVSLMGKIGHSLPLCTPMLSYIHFLCRAEVRSVWEFHWRQERETETAPGWPLLRCHVKREAQNSERKAMKVIVKKLIPVTC